MLMPGSCCWVGAGLVICVRGVAAGRLTVGDTILFIA